MRELDRYINEVLSPLGTMARDAYTEVIDECADETFNNVQKNTPVATGELKSTLIKVPIREGGRYGYRITYDGYKNSGTSNQIAYQYVANVLNAGLNGCEPTNHISKEVRKLKKMNARINKRFEEKINGIVK